jgi:hypothetical protein
MSNKGFFGSFEVNSMVRSVLQKLSSPSVGSSSMTIAICSDFYDRGAQLTLVGANRALQNPNIFTSELYKQAALAVAAGILIRLLVAIPTYGIRVLISFLGLFTNVEKLAWSEDVIDGIEFIEHSVLQIPFFLMSFMRYLSPAMDHMFMESLRWVDETYTKKHQTEDPAQLRAMYHLNLEKYSQQAVTAQKKDPKKAMVMFLTRYGKKAGLSLGIYLLSFVPYVGRLVLPAASFYTFNKAVGPQMAIVIFGGSVFLPRRYLVKFLQSYFSSRSLMRELVSNQALCIADSTIVLTTLPSSSHTSPVYAILPNRRKLGSAIAKACSTASLSPSSPSSKSPWSAFWSTGLPKLQQHT